MKALASYWYESSPFSWLVVGLLLPLSGLYCLLSYVRRKLYSSGIKKSFSANAPVVVIGNITVGGSGKTPLLIALCDYARKNGFTPGVVSRGYGGDVTGLKQVFRNDAAALVGDEPLMIHQKTDAPVVVSSDRVSAVNYLLKNNKCDVVFSDDGLQHYPMRRDFEIAVVDASRRFGNGFCLPAGPLREPVTRLNNVDLVVYNTTGTDILEPCSYSLRFIGVSSLKNNETKPFSFFIDKTVHAVAGIGHPERFFNQLAQHDINVIEHAFSDHHHYQQDDFYGWEDSCILMTEKDAIKCRNLSLQNAWVVSVNVEMSSTLETQLNTLLLPIMNGQMSHEKET